MKDNQITYRRTRIAPTPSGYLHAGNIISFALAAMLARKHGAKIWLRIDDLDRARLSRLYLDDIFHTLRFLDIPWDEGPADTNDFEARHSQRFRMDSYLSALEKLADTGFVYACVCSRKQLLSAHGCACRHRKIPLSQENASWRFDTSSAQKITVRNYNGSISEAVLPPEMKNFVVRKKDGFPAYQLTSVIDDALMEVDLVIRGADLWPSTVAQMLLAEALDVPAFRQATFYHHLLIMGSDGNKLSKSAGATSLKYLREARMSRAGALERLAVLAGLHNAPADWQELASLFLSKSS